MSLDILVLSAHPDDAELFCGGTLIKMRQSGYSVGILDCTRGEAATNGSIETRIEETKAANQILQLSFRENLGLEDGGLSDCPMARRKVVDVLRKYQVKILIAPLAPCRHPDHTAVAAIARSSLFFAANGKFPSDHPPWRPRRLLFHLEFHDRNPSFVVDITNQFEDRMKAVQAYKTQFYTPDNTDETTLISSHQFMEKMIARFRYFGTLIGTKYGEPYVIEEMIGIEDPVKHFG